MRKLAYLACFAAASLTCVLPVTSVQAQPAKRTFVSATGNDANASASPPCSLTAPCRTFQTAYGATIADGEINALDPASYGTLTITRGLSVVGHGWASITTQSGDAVTVNAGVNDKISIKGLLIDGIGTGVNGITVLNAGVVDIQDCLIRRFTNVGIYFLPNGSSSLFVSDTHVAGNLDGVAVSVPSSGPATVTGVFERVVAEYNSNDGFAFIGASVAGVSANFSVSNSVISNSGTYGILAGHIVSVMVQNSNVTNNGTFGLLASGPGATLRVTKSAIFGNITGIGASSSGNLISFGDNAIDGNGTNGAATNTIALK